MSQDVYMYKNNIWTLIGQLTESAADSWWISSGKILGDYAYLGEDSLEKVKLSDTDFSATNLGSGADDYLYLYYAAFIAVDGPVCSK
ncbi:Oidioi.mRNA.OKI2018_I69.chr2.g6544.t1.cds [Oikopleura dioica]|uniref:Oidioi.mRNA.OKI2018_I69.chr2.g6544.t1.cds n=1 Tax=Oikopleura dioica TaxID=34765 RepID=A0ABN7T5P1_OIKDI|nr:Oidioi.mRNA.OKI2018_I69.chr2.g6544.t1.cds [Oikopleura dioica]